MLAINLILTWNVKSTLTRLELSRAHTPRAASASEICNTELQQQQHNLVFVDDLYLPTLGQLCTWAQSTWPIGAVDRRGQQNALFVTFMGCAKRFEAYWSHFLLNSTNSLCLWVAWMPRSQDLAIFATTTTDDNRRQTKLIALPLAHVRGINM